MELNNISTHSLDEIKSARASANPQREKTYDTNILSFSKLEIGNTYEIRFLPDADKCNFELFRERNTRRLEFNSIKVKGAIHEFEKPIVVEIPAFNHSKFDAVATHFKDIESDYVFRRDDDLVQVKMAELDLYNKDPDLYNKLKKRTTYLYQGFVRHPDFKPTLLRISFAKQLHEAINTYAGPDSEITVNPADVEGGRTFKLVVDKPTTSYAKASYTKSRWSMNVSPLTTDERAYIEENGLYDLKTFIPKRPDTAHLKAMVEIFDACLAGQPYDYDTYGEMFRPSGVKIDKDGNIDFQTDKQVADVPNVQEATHSVEETPVSTTAEEETPVSTTADILREMYKEGKSSDDILTQLMNGFQNK